MALIRLCMVLALMCSVGFSQAGEPKPPRTPESSVTPGDRIPKRHQSHLERIKEGPIGLLFLGDSITDFWPRKSPKTWKKFENYQPADFGISGERTEGVIYRITNGILDGIDPKAVVIMIGTNNIGHFADEKPEWAAAGVKKIIDIVRTKLPNAKILLLAIFPRGDTADDEKRKRVVATNEIIKNLHDGTHVTYLDISAKFLEDNGNLLKDLMPDSLHPNDKGYQVWYDAMWPTLEGLLK